MGGGKTVGSGIQIPMLDETHRRMKWRFAMRIASLPDKRWATKAVEWNPASASDRRHADQWEGEHHEQKTAHVSQNVYLSGCRQHHTCHGRRRHPPRRTLHRKPFILSARFGGNGVEWYMCVFLRIAHGSGHSLIPPELVHVVLLADVDHALPFRVVTVFLVVVGCCAPPLVCTGGPS